MKAIALGLLLITTLSAHTCNKKTADAVGGEGDMAQQMGSIVDSKWVLQTLKGSPVNAPEGTEAPWIKLAKGAEQLEGFGGCNSLFGGFKVDGDRIQFPNLGSTKKYCEATQATENGFLSALRSADQFNLKGGILTLLKGGAEQATLKAQ